MNSKSITPARPSAAERRRLHLQRLERLKRLEREGEDSHSDVRPHQPRLAQQRQQIPGVQRLTRALEEIEYRQQELHAAANGLRAVLGIRSVAKAYAEFQEQGGVTAVDWQDWLDGKTLRDRSQHKSKRHLRLVASNDRTPVKRRRLGDKANR